MVGMYSSLALHEDVVHRRNPWSGMPEDRVLVVEMPCPQLASWELKVEVNEVEGHPAPGGARFNHAEVRKRLGRAARSESEWEVNWSYINATVAGTAEYPGFVPALLLVVDRKTGLVLSVQQEGFGGSIVSMMAKGLVDAARKTGQKPKRLHVNPFVECDALVPILKASGIIVMEFSTTPAADSALLSLFQRMAAHEGPFD
jgi:hypothetical protein